MLNDQPLTPIFQQAIVIKRDPSFVNIASYSFGSNFDFKEAKKVN
ncbi:Oligopeptide ABC transporter, periplasmic oligopeptide-binding protein OppA [Enterococcus sp. 5H]|nr:Oligopeptide ABC transporter, periplasmic oligopeptide-binding protein OppA [Enterococcus sp. 5H]